MLFFIAHLIWDTFPKNIVHGKCLFRRGVKLKFTECVSFYRIRKTLRFHYEAKIYLQNNI